MNIAIVDDNGADKEKLKEYVGKFFNNTLLSLTLKSYESGEEFIEKGFEKAVDVVFLDIFMKDMTGIEVAKKIREISQKCIIVFVSSSNNFASESYEVDAVSYLTKPYDYDKFSVVMKKIDDRIKKSSCYFDLKQKDGVKRIVLSKIIYVDYSNHYVQIHTQEEMVKSYTVQYQEVAGTLLKYKNFLICYRNVLINMDKVSKIEGKYFIMITGDNLPINRDKLKEISQIYHEYLYGKIEGGN